MGKRLHLNTGDSVANGFNNSCCLVAKHTREESLQKISFRHQILFSFFCHLRIVAIKGVDVGVAEGVADHLHSHLTGFWWSNLEIEKVDSENYI